MQLSVHTMVVVAVVGMISGHSRRTEYTPIQHPALFVECIMEVGRTVKVATMETGCGTTFARPNFQW